MTLNCLTCSQILQRANSGNDGDYAKEKHFTNKVGCMRSWSGNLSPPPYKPFRSGHIPVPATKKVKKNHHRLHSTGGVAFETGAEPRLVRSCGMRRDWSFEDLREKREEDRKSWRLQ